MMQLNNINNNGNVEQSQEDASGIVAFGILAAIIGAMTIFAKIQESKDRKVWDFVTHHYLKICNFIKDHQQDDPYYFENTKHLYKVKDVADTAEAFLKVLSVALTAPRPKSYQDSREYMEEFEKFLSKKSLPKIKDYLSSEMTLNDAGYLDYALVKKVFDTERDICFNLNKFWSFACNCAYDLDADPNEIYYKLMGRIKRFTDGIGGQAIVYDCDVVFYVVREIVKHVLKKYEKWKKSNEELEDKLLADLLKLEFNVSQFAKQYKDQNFKQDVVKLTEKYHSEECMKFAENMLGCKVDEVKIEVSDEAFNGITDSFIKEAETVKNKLDDLAKYFAAKSKTVSTVNLPDTVASKIKAMKLNFTEIKNSSVDVKALSSKLNSLASSIDKYMQSFKKKMYANKDASLDVMKKDLTHMRQVLAALFLIKRYLESSKGPGGENEKIVPPPRKGTSKYSSAPEPRHRAFGGKEFGPAYHNGMY